MGGGNMLANGFRLDIGTRDVPTPALSYYETDVVPADDVAGLIIATASHNLLNGRNKI